MLIGYARTSTLDQTAGFEAQLGELAQAGARRSSANKSLQLHREPNLKPPWSTSVKATCS
jgi:hypothetical protein